MLTKIEDEKILKLALRLGQKIAPLDANLEAQVIEIVEVLREAFDIGYWSGFNEGDRDGYDRGYNDGHEDGSRQ